MYEKGLHNESELSDLEMTDLISFMKTIITHITNENEERLMDAMRGAVIETESDIWTGKPDFIGFSGLSFCSVRLI